MKRTERRVAWQERVADFRAAGNTNVAAWCRAHDLKEHQMRYWLRQFPDEAVSDQSPREWMPILMVDDQEQSSEPEQISRVKVYVGDVTIEVQRGFDPELFSEVVKALRTRC